MKTVKILTSHQYTDDGHNVLWADKDTEIEVSDWAAAKMFQEKKAVLVKKELPKLSNDEKLAEATKFIESLTTFAEYGGIPYSLVCDAKDIMERIKE